MIIGTKAEFEQLADFILRDYLGNTYDGYDPLDIQAFAKDYLKLDISYFAFDPDTGIEGMRTGNQIILDDRLLDDKKAGERNFTIAHECGHDLINWQDPSYSPQTVVNYRIKSSRKSLVTEDDFKEWQAVIQFSELVKRLPENEPIFVKEGSPVYNSTVNDILARHCTAAKVPVISAHGLRHTHASLLLFAGVSIASVARRLGHASMTTTQKTYLHIIQELENQDVDIVMRSLSGLS